VPRAAEAAAAWDALAAAYTVGLVRAALEGGRQYAAELVAGLAVVGHGGGGDGGGGGGGNNNSTGTAVGGDGGNYGAAGGAANTKSSGGNATSGAGKPGLLYFTYTPLVAGSLIWNTNPFNHILVR